jgi:hypothetical protein
MIASPHANSDANASTAADARVHRRHLLQQLLQPLLPLLHRNPLDAD